MITEGNVRERLYKELIDGLGNGEIFCNYMESSDTIYCLCTNDSFNDALNNVFDYDEKEYADIAKAEKEKLGTKYYEIIYGVDVVVKGDNKFKKLFKLDESALQRFAKWINEGLWKLEEASFDRYIKYIDFDKAWSGK